MSDVTSLRAVFVCLYGINAMDNQPRASDAVTASHASANALLSTPYVRPSHYAKPS